MGHWIKQQTCCSPFRDWRVSTMSGCVSILVSVYENHISILKHLQSTCYKYSYAGFVHNYTTSLECVLLLVLAHGLLEDVIQALRGTSAYFELHSGWLDKRGAQGWSIRSSHPLLSRSSLAMNVWRKGHRTQMMNAPTKPTKLNKNVKNTVAGCSWYRLVMVWSKPWELSCSDVVVPRFWNRRQGILPPNTPCSCEQTY